MAKLLVILSGSIAAYKACEVLSQLVQRGHHVRTVATASALRFVGPATLEGLTGEALRTDLFAAGAALEHIELDRWADALIICPATAHTINRFAAGLADDLAGAIHLAHDRRKPCLFAPAMNPAMWDHPATRASVQRLKERGAIFLPVGLGRTACGEEGEGRLAEPAEILAGIEAALVRPHRVLRVLVTSGGTAEPIDGVRVLSNTSTGRTGAMIADYFAGRGHETVLLRARTAVSCPAATEKRFQSYADLEAGLNQLLKEESFDAVIHAAAVGDFAIESVAVDGVEHSPGAGKLDPARGAVVRLRPQPKLVDTLRARSGNPALRVVAFKLTRGADAFAIHRAVSELFAHSKADFVVHNDLTGDAGGDDFPSDIYQSTAGPAIHCPTRGALPVALERLLLATPSV